MRKRYKIPIGTRVEIVSKNCKYNGKLGTLEGKKSHHLDIYKVLFDNDESDYFRKYEIIPAQNIITIDNLDYETLTQIFNIRCLYETDIIIVKQKRFSFDEIEEAYIKHCNDLAAWANGTWIIGEEESFDIEYRENIIGLIGRMFEENDGGVKAVRETIMWEQWWVEGKRKFYSEGNLRYFNPEAKIETIFI